MKKYLLIPIKVDPKLHPLNIRLELRSAIVKRWILLINFDPHEIEVCQTNCWIVAIIFEEVDEPFPWNLNIRQNRDLWRSFEQITLKGSTESLARSLGRENYI